jgi:hypothetical protein
MANLLELCGPNISNSLTNNDDRIMSRFASDKRFFLSRGVFFNVVFSPEVFLV